MRHLSSLLLPFLFLTPALAEELRIVNIRVGQGDATLIQGPADATGKRVNVLFDAGSSPGFDGGFILRRVLEKNGISKTLNYMVVSHDDADHIGGIAIGPSHGKSFILGYDDNVGCEGDDDGDGQVDWIAGRKFYEPDPEELGKCKNFIVENWVDYGEANMRSNQGIDKYNGFANAMGTRITIADQASVDNFEIDLGSGAKMVAYAANGFVRGNTARIADVDSPNEKSLSFLVTYGSFDFLISGDLIGKRTGNRENAKVEEAVGKAILDSGRDVDVLHVNHHGADNGSAKKFLEMIKPNIAIISAGNSNNYDHPKNSVLKRLYNADVYRTIMTSFGTSEERIDKEVRHRVAAYQGDVVITTKGDDYEISTSRSYKSDKNYVPKDLQQLDHN